jgi:uncharacterized membrane protein
VKLRVLAIAASLVGIGVSVYLTAVHYAGFTPACPPGAALNCEAVLSSAYAVIAGTTLPTSAAGILWFSVSAVLWMRRLPRARLAWSAAGLITVLYLVFIEIVRLGTVCVWCTVAHLLVVTIFLAALTGTGPATPALEDGRGEA